MEAQSAPVLIKKYPNRRLYNTEISDYVTLDDLYLMVKQGADFVVLDAKTNEDLTRVTLAQIIFERETKGYNMLPISFLRQLIIFYDDNLRSVLPHYLEMVMKSFITNQDQIRSHSEDFQQTFGQFSPMRVVEEVTKKNITLFEQGLKMFFSNENKANDKHSTK